MINIQCLVAIILWGKEGLNDRPNLVPNPVQRGSLEGMSVRVEPLSSLEYLTISTAGWSSLVARRAHNPKVAGSNPAPATLRTPPSGGVCMFIHWVGSH